MTTAAPQAQTSIYETEITDPDLEKLLEEREDLKTAKGEATKAFNDMNTVVKAKIREHDLGADAPVRCGRFLITERNIEGKSVTFETNPSTRTYISLLPEDD